MANLSQDQRLRLASYINLMDARPVAAPLGTPRQRSGFPVPGTGAGNVYDNACWNWALTGGTGRIRDPGSAVSVWEDIIAMNILVEPPIVAGINNVDANYPGSGADFTLLRNNWVAAAGGNVAAQDTFKEAMLRIAARKNGMTVSVLPIAACTYTLHMKTAQWYSWHHMGIGINLSYRGAMRRTIVQTVPQTHVWHGCSVMWDEGQPDTVIGVSELKRAHVDVLDEVTVTCCICNAVPLGLLRPTKGWHRCGHCSAVYCRVHKAALNIVTAKTTFNPHTVRTCSRLGCVGQTRQI
ncbi:UNVERIFIED_ORG: hypothetical protein J2W38_006924 [Variovorax paradoxus]|nr:hypothetical protein [Variovorax paradoxus]